MKAVYDVSVLSEEKKKCLKVLSLFDVKGIEAKEAKELLKLESLDDIHELVDLGWLELSENRVCMHPLIQETMHQTTWTDECRQIAVDEMQLLFREITQNGRREDYVESQRDADSRSCTDSKLPDYKKLRNALQTSKSVLLHAGRDCILGSEEIYMDLLFATLINSPKDQEAYVIGNCERLLSDKDCKNPYSTMELYDYVVYLQCQKSDYDEAGKYLDRAKSFAQKWKDNYIWGLYYDMLGDFYDGMLDGAYAPEESSELVLLDKLLEASNQAICHMGKAMHERARDKSAKLLYSKYVLGKAALLIRSMPEKRRKIKALIIGTRKIIEKYIEKNIEKNTSDYAEVHSVYYMVWAWYYTLCEPEMKAVLRNLKEAAVINEARNISDLDGVDYYYIPAANMMWELGDIENTLGLLDEACKICDAHVDEIPYIRKKQDLWEYRQQVCEEEKIRRTT